MQQGNRAGTINIRLVLAFLLAPFASAAVTLASIGVRSADAALFPLAAAWISFLILLVCGVPLFHLLKHAGRLCVQVVVPLSAVCGMLIAPALFASAFSFWPDYVRNFNGQTAVWGLTHGAAVGVVFCAIAGIGFSRPQGRTPRT